MEFLKKLVLTLSIALSVGLACLTMVIFSEHKRESDPYVWVLVVVVVFLLACVLIFICIRALIELNRTSVKNQILNLQVKQESVMYQKVSDIYEQARTMNHDVKSYLVAVLGLLENAEYEEARERIVDIVERRLDHQVVYYAANGAINAVLNDKLAYAEQYNVHVEVSINGIIPDRCTMEAAVILANLLDNAIEAERQQEKKRVLLDMYEEKGMFYISVRNHVNESVLVDNPELQTTKENKTLHGLGIRSVRHLVKELDGSLLLMEDAGMFCAYVSFPTQKG